MKMVVVLAESQQLANQLITSIGVEPVFEHLFGSHIHRDTRLHRLRLLAIRKSFG
jgi:hypothetical protein